MLELERHYDATEDHKIVSWRELCFLDDGFSPRAARTLALRRDIDRERVSRAVRAGADHELVLKAVL